MGERVYQAAPQPTRFVVLHGLSHEAAYRSPIEQWWDRAITFIQRGRNADFGCIGNPELPMRSRINSL